MLLIAYGTRPEWIKIKPIVDLLDKRHIPFRILFTGQHTTLVSGKYDVNITIKDGNNRLDSIFTSILNRNDIFNNIDMVMVQGDTASALAVALAAFHRKIKVIHLEAGLRSYDTNNPYPEESYRRCISSMASIHFCPTVQNKENLDREKIEGSKYVVGNTSIDSLVSLKNKTTSGGGCLITLHRRENQALMSEWLKTLNKMAFDYKMKFTFISHPNTDLTKLPNIENLNVIPPQTHDDILNLIIHSDIIISDSGGIQEEASYFRKPIIVCRTVTERPESVGTTSFMCNSPSNLIDIFNYVRTLNINDKPCPYGNGDSSTQIVNILYE